MRITKRVHQHEIGLWFRHGDFKRPLRTGRRWILNGRFTPNTIETINTLDTRFDHKMLDILLQNDALRELLHVVELTDAQRALVWKDGRLAFILGPGRHAFWKTPFEIKVEVFDVNTFKFEHPNMEAILGFPGGVRFFKAIRVESNQRVLLFREGELFESLGPGLYVYWLKAGTITWTTIDLREQVADVSGQEIMTADKVTLRVNLMVTFRVTDPMVAVNAVANYEQALYREAQLALRESVGTRTLDKMLTDKDAVGRQVRDLIRERAREFGVDVRSVGLRDIILPGDMKMILNQVIEAQKQAEANLIRRREETAAARSQANTARLLAENPHLARMKELEALQEILRGADTTFVLGQRDLLSELSKVIAGETKVDRA